MTPSGAAGTTPADGPAGQAAAAGADAQPGHEPAGIEPRGAELAGPAVAEPAGVSGAELSGRAGAEPAGVSGAELSGPAVAESAGVSGAEPVGLPGSTRLNGGQAARPRLIRALNEQLLLSHIRQLGPCSRAELARLSGLSKPTVSLALVNVERSGLVRIAGQRTGVPGRSARLYEVRPEAGFVLGLDIGLRYLRGALADLTGQIRAKASARARASSMTGRVTELIRLADALCADAGLDRAVIPARYRTLRPRDTVLTSYERPSQQWKARARRYCSENPVGASSAVMRRVRA